MSNKIKAIILKNLMDELTLVEALNSLKINYVITDNQYIINSNLKIPSTSRRFYR